jgi:hypothetical protein
MKPWGVSKEKKRAILEAYLRGEKLEVISVQFGVWLRYAPQLAKARGFPCRKPGRPNKTSSFPPRADPLLVALEKQRSCDNTAF